MLRYFPSKKVFVVGVLAIVLLAWSVVYTKTSQQNSTISENLLRTVASAESFFPDFDNDGLFDWEEELYGTDPKNVDSDGDGVYDGKQYATSPNNLALRLSDSVYSAVNRIGEESQNFPDPKDLLSTKPTVYEAPFTESDFKTIDDSQEADEAYIAIMLLLLSEHAEVLEADPTAVVGEWLNTKDSSTLEKINYYSNKTKEVANSLLTVQVPKRHLQTHLGIANNLLLSAISLDDVSTTIEDPMGGFFAMANYVNYQSKYIKNVYVLAEVSDQIQSYE